MLNEFERALKEDLDQFCEEDGLRTDRVFIVARELRSIPVRLAEIVSPFFKRHKEEEW